MVSIANVVYVLSPFGSQRHSQKMLTVTVPEDLEFEGMFDDIFKRFANSYELTEVSTTNMGSLYQLKYILTMKDTGETKQMIDHLRCLNGNLKITLGAIPQGKDVL